MSPTPESRSGHRCLSSHCGHPESEHVATPELAGEAELVVFCSTCRHHEVHRLRGIWRRFGRGAPRGARTVLSRPA